MTKKKIAVIGAGLGGLTASIRLANKGFSVDVYEQNSSVGGKAGEIKSDGYRFDTGPSLLTMPFIIKDIFEDSGENILDYLSIKQLDILCKYFFDDGVFIDAYSDLKLFAKEIEEKTSATSVQLFDYLKYCEKIYDLTADLFLFNDIWNKNTLLSKKALKTLVNISKIDPFRTMHNANAAYFKDQKLIQIFDRYATYNGSNPYNAPATLNIIQHVEYNLGGYIVERGISSIPLALQKLALKKGVTFFFNSSVEKILVDKKVVSGIKTKNQEVFYDVVISNVDANISYSKLLSDNHTRYAKRYQKLEPSSSALVFYWGVEGVHEKLEMHNILFSSDYSKEFQQIFNENKCPDDPTVYIYISSKKNKEDAPPNNENWFVMINTPYNTGQNWSEEINKARSYIINKIKTHININIESKIKFEKILTPIEIEKVTGSYRGSLYGISSNNKMSAFMRQPNKSKEYKNLYFCGGSVHPGGGIPLVLLSGKIAAVSVINDLL